MATNEWDWGTVDTGTSTGSSSIYGYDPKDDAGFDAAYNAQQAGLSGGGGSGSSGGFDLGGLLSSILGLGESKYSQKLADQLAAANQQMWQDQIDAADADFDTIEETGGSKTHTLTTAEIPAHTHTYTYMSHTNTNNDQDGPPFPMGSGESSPNTSSTGGGGAHNNVQPYITVYFWKRTV